METIGKIGLSILMVVFVVGLAVGLLAAKIWVILWLLRLFGVI